MACSAGCMPTSMIVQLMVCMLSTFPLSSSLYHCHWRCKEWGGGRVLAISVGSISKEKKGKIGEKTSHFHSSSSSVPLLCHGKDERMCVWTGWCGPISPPRHHHHHLMHASRRIVFRTNSDIQQWHVVGWNLSTISDWQSRRKSMIMNICFFFWCRIDFYDCSIFKKNKKIRKYS